MCMTIITWSGNVYDSYCLSMSIINVLIYNSVDSVIINAGGRVPGG